MDKLQRVGRAFLMRLIVQHGLDGSARVLAVAGTTTAVYLPIPRPEVAVYDETGTKVSDTPVPTTPVLTGAAAPSPVERTTNHCRVAASMYNRSARPSPFQSAGSAVYSVLPVAAVAPVASSTNAPAQFETNTLRTSRMTLAPRSRMTLVSTGSAAL